MAGLSSFRISNRCRCLGAALASIALVVTNEVLTANMLLQISFIILFGCVTQLCIARTLNGYRDHQIPTPGKPSKATVAVPLVLTGLLGAAFACPVLASISSPARSVAAGAHEGIASSGGQPASIPKAAGVLFVGGLVAVGARMMNSTSAASGVESAGSLEYWEIPSRLRRVRALIIFLLFSRFLLSTGIQVIPPSLLGLLSLFALLIVLEKRGLAAPLFSLLEPGYRFLVKWALLFFLPALVKLPLVDAEFSTSVILRLTALLLSGFVVQLLVVAGVASAFGDEPAVALAVAAEKPKDYVVYPRLQRPFQFRWLNVYLVTMVLSLVASKLQVCTELAEAAFMLASSLGVLVVSNSWSAKVKMVFHPITATLFGSWIAAAIWAAQAGPSVHFLDVIQRYSSADGVGSLLTAFLGPLVVALALLLYERRELLRANLGPLIVTSIISAASGLFSSAFIAAALGLPTAWAKASLGRCLTAPLAIAAAGALDAQASLTLPLVVITGLLGAAFAAPLLTALGVKSPRARGIAVGAGSHVIGTVSLAQSEPQSFAFSAVGFVLVGGFSVVLTAIPPVRAALLYILR